ncbi:MAG: hypothetical protein Q7V40_18670 [Pseudolabrys sp.]|nr:hypothetical protein [Pseudolabrys sp.]
MGENVVISIDRPNAPDDEVCLMAKNVCPECGYEFQGSGFEGIDSHWRAKHEKIMPYEEAWRLIKEGKYLKRSVPN